MMRAGPIHALGLAALIFSASPVQAQSGGLLGDSDLSSSSSARDSSAAPAEERRERRSRRTERRIDVSPYLELDQTAIWDLKGGNGDVLTYTTLAAGVTASVQTQSVSVGADVRYAHQFAWNRGSTDQDIVSGIVNASIVAVPGLLNIEGGALATRVRSDGFVGANNSLAGVDNISKAYSFYLGPNLSTTLGDMTVTGAYRLGYNRVDNDNGAAIGLGFPVAGSFEESWIHSANAAIGMQPGALPFGWSLGGGYTREDSSQLDQRYENKFVRADVTVPISYNVALVGGGGFEDTKISNKDALRDVNNDPVRDADGRFVTDPASPRRLSYDQDGLIWDVGVMWRPSPRLQAEARLGHRYGSMSYTGNLSWHPNERTSINAVLFDSVDSFGRSMNSSLANLGTDFSIGRNPFSGDLAGCAVDNSGGGGLCVNDTLTGLSAANFRNRGVIAQFARRGEPWGFSVAAGYSQRKFLADSQSVLAAANGQTDDNYFASIGVTRPLGTMSAIDAMAYWNYFDSEAIGVGDVTNIGANLSYRRTIWRRLQASAAVGIDSIDRTGQEAYVSLLAQLGLRYQF